jgi:hypothetical protein
MNAKKNLGLAAEIIGKEYVRMSGDAFKSIEK